MNRLQQALIVVFCTLLWSCNDSENQNTNTHNTSQPSAGAHVEDIKIDQRSQVPPSRLNDGNVNSGSRMMDTQSVQEMSDNQEGVGEDSLGVVGNPEESEVLNEQ